ncbi:MAG: PilT/PilU family type 4a pilus ATPase [Phycisphaeraceae bacterium]|jgi:twitching motility protein PilT|nr:PilT/PilU family type 4a pilus ATPase [Phycisphaeraceae bacterium]
MAELTTNSVSIQRVRDRRSLSNTPLRRLFETAVKYEASDLLIRGGQVPKLRLRGDLKSLDVEALDDDEFEAWIEEGISDAQWNMYARLGALDVGVDIELSDGSVHRFRVNVYRTRGRSGLAARRVGSEILNFDELHLPPILARVAEHQQGLVLVVGITGSGKSTSLAAMIQHINKHRPCHIVTLEDPIEYIFQDDQALVSQREIGIDVPDFSSGLRSLVREDPDVVLIGEMRDKETFETALQAAETGHLVFGTIHASSASQAFGRIYDLFSPEEREGIRNMLAYQMRAFVYQKLLPTIRKDMQRVPAVEILLQSANTRKYILEGREHELEEVIRANREAGMQTFTDHLVQLVEAQYIHPKVAQASATSSEEVRMRLRGIKAE